MTTVERLIDAAKDIWESYNEHPFVKGIENGTLDREKFRYYIVQDSLYLEDYARSFAVGVAKAKSIETSNIFLECIKLITNSDKSIHQGYIDKFGINQEELDNTSRVLDNLSYTSYMLRVAYEEGEAEILTAILSCAYSYELIAKKMVKNNPNCVNHDFYGDWIRGYSSDDYASGNILLIDMLNKLTKNYTEHQLKHLIEIFIACSKYEYLFWDFSWKMIK